MPRTSDLVSDSRLHVSFSPDGTTHNFSEFLHGRQRVSRQEQWRRKKYLGEGGFGRVWLEACTHGKSQGELRAVKGVRKQRNAIQAIDYNRELEAVAKFSHHRYEAFFVKSYGWYETAKAIYITMEYLPHGDLFTYLEHTRPTLPLDEARLVTYQILEGLDFMHSNGFAHRDIKPSNILIKSCPPDSWWIKLSDFGISKRAEDGFGPSTIKGTRGFMAPELQGLGESLQKDAPIDFHAADMWALGEVAFRMLHGEYAFRDQGAFALYSFGRAQCPSTKLVSVAGEECADFVAGLMLVDPKMRRKTSAALAHSWLESVRIETEDTSVAAMSASMAQDEEASLRSRSSMDSLEEPSARWSEISGTTRDGSTSFPVSDFSSLALTPTAGKSLQDRQYTPDTTAGESRGPDKAGSPKLEKADEAEAPVRGAANAGPSAQPQDQPVQRADSPKIPPRVEAFEDLVPAEGWHALFNNPGEQARLSALKTIEVLIGRGYTFPYSYDGGNAVHFAATNGLISLIDHLYQIRVDIKAKDKNGCTAIHHAAQNDQITTIDRLSSLGLDVKAKDFHGRTALPYAAEKGHIAVAEYLCSAGLDVKTRDNYGWISIHHAARGGHVAMIHFLDSRGVDLKAVDTHGWNAIHHAAYAGNISSINYLCSLGVDPKVKDKYGRAAIHRAADTGHIATVNLLHSLGLNVKATDAYGWTVIHFAARQGNTVMVEHLCTLGLDIKAKDIHGRSAMHHASETNNMAMIDYLCSKGLDRNATDSHSWTAMHYAARFRRKDMVDHLHSIGLDLKAKDVYGWTPMHHAAQNGDIALIDHLCSLGLNSEDKNYDGLTPSDLSRNANFPAAVEHFKKLREQKKT